MKFNDRPKNTTECAREKCGHVLGTHYTTYDGKADGCGYRLDDQRDGLITCDCDGFLIAYRYKPSDDDSPSPLPYHPAGAR